MLLYPNGQDIEDPDTGNSLGSIELPKVRVRVTHVCKKNCLSQLHTKLRR